MDPIISQLHLIKQLPSTLSDPLQYEFSTYFYVLQFNSSLQAFRPNFFPPLLVLSVCTECSDQPVINGLKATILSSEEHIFTDCISYSISYSLLYPRLNQICNSDRKSVICYEFCITLTKYQHALLNSLWQIAKINLVALCSFWHIFQNMTKLIKY
jgi:hypothetical protein